MIDWSVIAAALSAIAAILAAVAAVRSGGGAPAQTALLTDAVNDLGRNLETLRGALADEFRRARDEAQTRGRSLREEVGQHMREGADRQDDAARVQREEVLKIIKALGESLNQAVSHLGTGQAEKLEATIGQIRDMNQTMAKSLAQGAEVQKERLDGIADEIRRLSQRSAEAGETLKATVEARLETLRQDNASKLEEMRRTVDEKLQSTLEQRLNSSFKLVSDQLEQVFKSVGEMQSLAAGVGDLKKVLTNVKTRGTWAEVSLGGLLEQVLTADQYARNVEVSPGSNERVDFAIRLPGQEGDGAVWLPIDAKFPSEDYERLIEASDRADAAGVELALKGIEERIRGEGKSICAKYICPPHTTDFAILYLPTEGLYAEVIRRPGLVDDLQRQCRIVVAGPTVLMAILSSLRMGFRTLAIQKRSGEVWQLLGAVKTEFGKYGEVLDKVKKKLDEASNQIDNVARRRRAMDRTLRGVERLSDADADQLLPLDRLIAEEALDAAE
jgi:DNA recombination protein RmuC